MGPDDRHRRLLVDLDVAGHQRDVLGDRLRRGVLVEQAPDSEPDRRRQDQRFLVILRLIRGLLRLVLRLGGDLLGGVLIPTSNAATTAPTRDRGCQSSCSPVPTSVPMVTTVSSRRSPDRPRDGGCAAGRS
ncbi:hypothetical protein [Dactylosporangium cerinum]